MSDTTPEWTATPPTKPGKYFWRRSKEGPTTYVVFLDSGEWWCGKTLACAELSESDEEFDNWPFGEFWPVPIQEPRR